jgi:hypothetical protein
MPDFKIIGTDLKEYGPVSAEQIRQWITERRVDSDTKLQAEGDSEWRRLADVPEFAEAFPRTGPSTCPNCGEPFEDGFDSCWKCGTGKDGCPPKHKIQVEADAKEVAVEPDELCPKCGSSNVRRGELLPGGRGSLVMFKPEGTRFFIWSFSGGVDLSSERSSACLDCGLVWCYGRPDELKEFISKHCERSDKDDAHALLSEGVRLESQGDTAGALAKFEAVMEKFPGTEGAKDAEFSIRNLKDKSG